MKKIIVLLCSTSIIMAAQNCKKTITPAKQMHMVTNFVTPVCNALLIAYGFDICMPQSSPLMFHGVNMMCMGLWEYVHWKKSVTNDRNDASHKSKL